MTLAFPHLWIPRKFEDLILMSHIKKGPSGHMVREPGVHMVNNCVVIIRGFACSFCDPDPPKQFLISFSGVTGSSACYCPTCCMDYGDTASALSGSMIISQGGVGSRCSWFGVKTRGIPITVNKHFSDCASFITNTTVVLAAQSFHLTKLNNTTWNAAIVANWEGPGVSCEGISSSVGVSFTVPSKECDKSHSNSATVTNACGCLNGTVVCVISPA